MSNSTLSAPPAAEIVLFRPEEHLQGAVEALLQLRRAEGTYPPRNEVKASISDVAYWLLSEDVLARWTALVDGRVVGHIAVAAPRPFLRDALADLNAEPRVPRGFCEVTRFFVGLNTQGRGAGAALLAAARNFACDLGLQPALAVAGTSFAARRFCARHGMTEAGSFRGVHGRNFVFVDMARTALRREPAVTVLAA